MGGAQRYVYLLATNLDRERYEVVVACGSGSWLVGQLRAHGIEVIVVPRLAGMRRPAGSDVLVLLMLYRLFRKRDFDIVHANSTKAGFIGRVAAKLARIPVIIFTAHGFVMNEPLGRLKKLALNGAEWMAACLSDAIIAVSEADRLTALQYKIATESRLFRIRNGIRPSEQRWIRDTARSAMDDRFGEKYTAIGTVANFYRTKGLETLLRAAKEVVSAWPLARFVIVGDGELRPRLESLRQALSLEAQVIFLGQRTDIECVLAGLDLFVMPSLKEGLPFALLEAMASGLPIVATRVGGIPEALDEGRAGVLVPPGDPRALAEGIVALLQDKARAKVLGAIARDRVSTEFRLSEMVSTTAKLYEKLLARKGIRCVEWSRRTCKRVFDGLLAGFGLLGAGPLGLLIALCIKLEDGGPVFYSQLRVGQGGRPFRVFKFRSMVRDAERLTGAVWASADDPRVTRVGRVLRATALDELPQLWNIFKGDMSFVGPRPERVEFVEHFRNEIQAYMDRFVLRPGLTGLAQIFAQYDSPPRRKLRYDLLYLRRQGFWLDLKLIGLSFLITFRARWEHRGAKFS